jgi:hypothetical protein
LRFVQVDIEAAAKLRAALDEALPPVTREAPAGQ